MIEKIEYILISRDHINYRIKWLNDVEINRHLGTFVRGGTDRSFHEKWFKGYEEENKAGKKIIFMIKVDNCFVGQVGLLDINNDDKNAILYIVIGEKAYWGKGIAKSAIAFIHDYAFNRLGLHKINLYAHSNNTRAIALYEKMGYQHVGIYHDNVLRDGAYEDETLMEIIHPTS